MASRRRRTKFDHEGGSGDRGNLSQGSRGKRGEPHVPEIDLHGCTLESAVRRLSGGLARLRAAGRTSVLVITGKGYGSPGERAVLTPGIERWLRSQDAQSLGVAGHRKARDGGAFEVSISRGRSMG